MSSASDSAQGEQSGEGSRASRSTSTRRRWFVLGLALLGSPLLAEFGLRWLLFGNSELAQSLGRGLRKPALFARDKADDRLWLLRNRMDPELCERYERELDLDARFGWRNDWLDPALEMHPLLPKIGARRPVPFYGASFVRVEFALEMHRHELGSEFAVIPYGVGGFGMGQALAVARSTLSDLEGRTPLVLLGIQLEADPHRALLGFRAAAKPRVRLDEAGNVVLEEFEPAHTREYLRAHPLGYRSYVLGWLLGPASPLPWVRSSQAQRQDHDLDLAFEVNRAIVREFAARANAIGAELGLVLFHAPGAFSAEFPKSERQREQAFERFLDAEGLSYVNTRVLLEQALERGEALASFYEPFDTAAGLHPSPRGYALLNEALVTLIENATGAESAR